MKCLESLIAIERSIIDVVSHLLVLPDWKYALFKGLFKSQTNFITHLSTHQELKMVIVSMFLQTLSLQDSY